MCSAAYAIHAEIHKARPDVLCAAHSHSLHGRAMSATGRALDMLTQDFCVFWNDHVLYENFGGLVLAPEEGQKIAACLGGKKVALLANREYTYLSGAESMDPWFSDFVVRGVITAITTDTHDR